MRSALILGALALALAPALVQAHIEHEREHIQGFQGSRSAQVTVVGTAARYDLLSRLDPMTNVVTYELDPSRGRLHAEYRTHPSDAATSFAVTWTLARFVEYHDTNADSRYQPTIDTVVRAWRLPAYAWNVTGPRTVLIGAQEARDVLWNGAIAGGPNLTIEVDAAGAAFTDEGARVLPQDIILYFDASGFPPRGTGNLYALEGTILAPAGARVLHDVATNTSIPNATAGMLIQSAARQAGLDWGAQATLDKSEQFIFLGIEEPQADGTRAFHLDYPRFDKTLHQVLVVSMEYVLESKRGTPGVEIFFALAGVAAVAIARSRT